MYEYCTKEKHSGDNNSLKIESRCAENTCEEERNETLKKGVNSKPQKTSKLCKKDDRRSSC